MTVDLAYQLGLSFTPPRATASQGVATRYKSKDMRDLHQLSQREILAKIFSRTPQWRPGYEDNRDLGKTGRDFSVRLFERPGR